MDDVARYNTDRWDRLNQVNALFTRPHLDLDAESARQQLDPDGRLGDVSGRRVLCLAGGGGRQSVAFALLGADVTVLDLSEAKLRRDRETTVHYNVAMRIEQDDMRDLSRFDDASFDLVWHPYTINFVPNARVVFRQVARIMRTSGKYTVMCANPFTSGLTTQDWTGNGYLLKRPYTDGAEITYEDEPWVYRHVEGADSVQPPREYRHTLNTMINGLAETGFVILNVTEHTHGQPEAEPGSWEHFTTFAPPWFTFWTTYNPDALHVSSPLGLEDQYRAMKADRERTADATW